MAKRVSSKPIWIWILIYFVIIMIALAIHHTWLTTHVIAAGDDGWNPNDIYSKYAYPWPSIWRPFTAFGKPNFVGNDISPILAFGGTLSKLHMSGEIITLIIFYVPVAVFSVLSPWLLATELNVNPLLAVLSGLAYAGNSYMLLIPGQVTVAAAEALAPLVLLCYIRLLKGKLIYAPLSVLALSLVAAYELRITYLTIVLIVLRLIFEIPRSIKNGKAVSIVLYTVIIILGFALSQMYWILPLHFYAGNPNLPIPSTPWIAFMNIVNGLTAVSPWWTNGVPIQGFTPVPVAPVYLLLPLSIFVSLLIFNSLDLDLAWLIFSALCASFLIKSTNAPAGQIYTWLFDHILGWNLFRDSSPLYWIVALAYSVLIPKVLLELISIAKKAQSKLNIGFPALTAASIIFCLALLLTNFIPLETGQLGYETVSFSMPSAMSKFITLEHTLPKHHVILWLVGFGYLAEPTTRAYLDPGTPNHPTLALYGTPSFNDPFAVEYCDAAPDIPFCYYRTQTMRYIVKLTGASAIVLPSGQKFILQQGFPNYQDIYNKLYKINVANFGKPTVLGNTNFRLAVWRIKKPSPLAIYATKSIYVVGAPASMSNSIALLKWTANVPIVYEYGNRDAMGVALRAQKPPPGSAILYPASSGMCYVMPDHKYIVVATESDSALHGETSLTVTYPLRTRLLPSRIAPHIYLYKTPTIKSALVKFSYPPSLLLQGCIVYSAGSYNLVTHPHNYASICQPRMNDSSFSATIKLLDCRYRKIKGSILYARIAYDPGWHLSGSYPISVNGLFQAFILSSHRSQILSISYAPDFWQYLGEKLYIVFLLIDLSTILFILLRQRKRIITAAHESSTLLNQTEETKQIDLPWRSKWMFSVGISSAIIASILYYLIWKGIIINFVMGGIVVSDVGGAYADLFGIFIGAYLVGIILAVFSKRKVPD
jgi:hypothetical protein